MARGVKLGESKEKLRDDQTLSGKRKEVESSTCSIYYLLSELLYSASPRIKTSHRHKINNVKVFNRST